MVSDQIIKVLDNLCEKFGLAIDWSSKNIQPYLEELMAKAVNYKIAMSIMWLISGIFYSLYVVLELKLGSFVRKNIMRLMDIMNGILQLLLYFYHQPLEYYVLAL